MQDIYNSILLQDAEEIYDEQKQLDQKKFELFKNIQKVKPSEINSQTVMAAAFLYRKLPQWSKNQSLEKFKSMFANRKNEFLGTLILLEMREESQDLNDDQFLSATVAKMINNLDTVETINSVRDDVIKNIYLLASSMQRALLESSERKKYREAGMSKQFKKLQGRIKLSILLKASEDIIEDLDEGVMDRGEDLDKKVKKLLKEVGNIGNVSEDRLSLVENLLNISSNNILWRDIVVQELPGFDEHGMSDDFLEILQGFEGNAIFSKDESISQNEESIKAAFTLRDKYDYSILDLAPSQEDFEHIMQEAQNQQDPNMAFINDEESTNKASIVTEGHKRILIMSFQSDGQQIDKAEEDKLNILTASSDEVVEFGQKRRARSFEAEAQSFSDWLDSRDVSDKELGHQVHKKVKTSGLFF